MKKKLTKLLVLAVGVLFVGQSALAQSNSDQLFDGVENTKQYSTLDLLHMDREVSTFANLVALADMEVALALADTPHTLFVPTNVAFAEMSIKDFAKLTDPKNRVKLIDFVKRHYLSTKVLKTDFKDADIMETDGQGQISVSKNGNTVTVGGAQIIEGDIETSDGVIQIIDAIIQKTEM